MTDKEKKPTSDSKSKTKTVTKKEEYSIQELSQKLNIDNYRVAAIFIKNRISLSKRIGVDEFKKLMK
jgi:hypothetical protein